MPWAEDNVPARPHHQLLPNLDLVDVPFLRAAVVPLPSLPSDSTDDEISDLYWSHKEPLELTEVDPRVWDVYRTDAGARVVQRFARSAVKHQAFLRRYFANRTKAVDVISVWWTRQLIRRALLARAKAIAAGAVLFSCVVGFRLMAR